MTEVIHQIQVGDELPPLQSNSNIQPLLGFKTDPLSSTPTRFSQELPRKFIFRQNLAYTKKKNSDYSTIIINKALAPVQNTNMVSTKPPAFDPIIPDHKYEVRSSNFVRGSFRRSPSVNSSLPKPLKQNLFIMSPKPNYDSYKAKLNQANQGSDYVSRQYSKIGGETVINEVTQLKDIHNILGDSYQLSQIKTVPRFYCPDS